MGGKSSAGPAFALETEPLRLHSLPLFGAQPLARKDARLPRTGDSQPYRKWAIVIVVAMQVRPQFEVNYAGSVQKHEWVR